MKYRNVLRVGQIRKYNTYLENCANGVHSPLLKIMILARKINGARIGQTVTKGT